jgi:hypothetical protein
MVKGVLPNLHSKGVSQPLFLCVFCTQSPPTNIPFPCSEQSSWTTIHANHTKEDVEVEQEKGCSSCQTNSEEEHCEEGIMDVEAELISSLSELRK